MQSAIVKYLKIRVITKLPNSEQSSKGKVKTHKYINRQGRLPYIFIEKHFLYNILKFVFCSIYIKNKAMLECKRVEN
jgi:hypothetical protein